MIKAVPPRFRAANKGVIVNIALIGGRIGFPLYSLYNSTKWAVEDFSDWITSKMDNTADSVAVVPEKVASVVYRSSTHKSGKFRYPAKGGAKMVLFL